VCEGDSDRAFYQEVNERLLAPNKGGSADTIFLNAQNKSTVRRIVRPLREMGIPAAAVVDFDIIKGTDLKDLLVTCSVPPALIHSLTTLRGDLEAKFRTLGLDMKRGGISLLPSAEQEACRSLLDQLEAYGVFVVPTGEVESWLSHLGVTAAKEDWLAAIFERMRADPDQSDYVRPVEGDVWAFVRRIATWINDPARLGISAA
jgi:hypothetical protein